MTMPAAARSDVKWLVVEFHPGLANPLEMARLCLEGVRKILAEMNVRKKEQYHEKNRYRQPANRLGK